VEATPVDVHGADIAHHYPVFNVIAQNPVWTPLQIFESSYFLVPPKSLDLHPVFQNDFILSPHIALLFSEYLIDLVVVNELVLYIRDAIACLFVRFSDQELILEVLKTRLFDNNLFGHGCFAPVSERLKQYAFFRGAKLVHHLDLIGRRFGAVPVLEQHRGSERPVVRQGFDQLEVIHLEIPTIAVAAIVFAANAAIA
jgi:hypothetical protein